MIISNSPASLARRDAANYRDNILGYGSSITDTNLSLRRQFSEQLYEICGRSDFFDFRSAGNIGTGSFAVSWLGKTATLVNGAAWAGDGIHLLSSSFQYIDTGLQTVNLPASFLLEQSGALSFSSNADPSPYVNVEYIGIYPNPSTVSAIATKKNVSEYEADASGRTSPGFDGASFSASAVNAYSANATGTTTGTLATSYTSNHYGMPRTIFIGCTNGFFQTGSTAFAAILPVALSRTQYDAVRTAYKATIGQGLGLS